ncbi:MAG: carbon storage regulator CsrA [Thermoguttaceae bacterium]|nr:carbon storage regulator CsrA [Thermoguttaceae bacterium]
MLVLSRKKNESIVINDNIIIVVVDVRGDKVRIGVNAPSDVTVHRKEVYDAIRRQMSVQSFSVNTTDTLSAPSEDETKPESTEPDSTPKTKPIAKTVIKKKT